MKDLREFHQKFMQNCQNVYEPAEDSELLLETALSEVREDDEVLEVGGGSGFVSYFIKDRCKFLIATDINPNAVRCMKRLGIECIRTDIARGINYRFSLVLFNPPYLELEEFERKHNDHIRLAVDGGEKGVEVSVRFLEEIVRNLKPCGRIIMISSSTTFPELRNYLENSNYSWKIVKTKKLFFEELYALKLELR